MNPKMHLGVGLTQRLLMNPSLIQVITLLQQATIELKQEVMNFLDSNPLLEVTEVESAEEENNGNDMSNYTAAVNTTSYARQTGSIDLIENISGEIKLRELLLSQTLGCHFNTHQQNMAEAIIDAIDDDGYLTLSLAEIREIILKEKPHLTVNDEEMDMVLKEIQGFDPPGVGARDANECLMLQLTRMNISQHQLHCARKVMEQDVLHADNLSLQHLAHKTGLSMATLTTGLKVLNELDFHPGKVYQSTAGDNVEPELVVKKVNGKWQISLCDGILTRLGINTEYQKIITSNSRNQQYKKLVEQLQEAKLVINGIKKRNETLLKVASYIIEKQIGFLEHGDSALKPLCMSQVSHALDLHESTISRITSGKYIDTPHGLYELKHFFSNRVESGTVDEQSAVAVMHIIKAIIDKETSAHIFSDDEIAAMLKAQQIHISRRTIAKYRDKMNIPSSYKRAQLMTIKSVIK